MGRMRNPAEQTLLLHVRDHTLHTLRRYEGHAGQGSIGDSRLERDCGEEIVLCCGEAKRTELIVYARAQRMLRSLEQVAQPF